MELLVYVRRDLEPGHRDIAGAELPRVHEDVISEPVPLLGGSLREPPNQHGAFLPETDAERCENTAPQFGEGIRR
jgi:hypothetical protein